MIVAIGAVTTVLHPRTRAWIKARARRRAIEDRRKQREAALEEVHGPYDELAELTACVDRLDQLAPGESERLELEALLDRYVELAVARCHAEDRLLRAERFGGAAYGGSLATPVRRELDAQQRAHHVRVGEHLAALEDQIAGIADLIRLYAARAELPELDYLVGDGDLGRWVELLDEADPGGGGA